MSQETKENPSNDIKVAEVPQGYIPMSAPIQRLQVPERPGYVRYWFRGDAGRIQRALQAGYQFVNQADVKVNNFDLGGDAKQSGSTDLGSRVSVITGDETGFDGQPNRLYLMEIPKHLYERGQEFLEETNEGIAQALRSGLIGADEGGDRPADRQARYTKTGVPDFLNPVKRRR